MTVQKMKYLFFSVFMTLSLCISAQNVDSLLFVGDSLRRIYRFEESLDNYNVALEIAIEDSTMSTTHILERIRCSENGKNLMSFVDSPVVEAKHKFSIEDFFLYYPLPDKSWRPTPNQLDSLSSPFSKAIYFPHDSEKICYSSVDTLGVRNIYVTEFKDSTWARPTQLVDSMFSPSDDIYPMLSADGKELYFSSKGLYGVGGYDLYVSKWDEENGKWGSPMNMGYPYSSPYDDFLYAPSRDGKHVVFASNRECPSDSVWVYVLKHQDLPVRKDIADSDELKRIMNLDPAGYAERIERKSPVETNIPENLDTKKYLDKITEVTETNPSGVQGICPDGWHVPSIAEWQQLSDYVSSVYAYRCDERESYIAKALASATDWGITNTTFDCAIGNNTEANNATGFSALPAGITDPDFNGFEFCTVFWSATVADEEYNFSWFQPNGAFGIILRKQVSVLVLVAGGNQFFQPQLLKVVTEIVEEVADAWVVAVAKHHFVLEMRLVVL